MNNSQPISRFLIAARKCRQPAKPLPVGPTVKHRSSSRLAGLSLINHLKILHAGAR